LSTTAPADFLSSGAQISGDVSAGFVGRNRTFAACFFVFAAKTKMQCARISLLLLCAAGLAAGGRDQAEPRKCCIRVLLRGLRGGSGAPGAAGAGCAPSFSAPQPCADEAAPAGGAEEAPGFNGFVDNGVSYAQQFADQMQQRRQMGHSVAAPTPAMFAGEEGVSFDANGNFQLGEFGQFAMRAIHTQDRMTSPWI